eukprot:13218243-Alexandrium_andersonii.AAC.1
MGSSAGEEPARHHRLARIAGKPGTGFLGVLGEPESEARLLPGRFRAEPPGKPQEVISVGEEGDDRAVALPSVDQFPHSA